MKWSKEKPKKQGLYWLDMGLLNTNFNGLENVPFLVRVIQPPFNDKDLMIVFIENRQTQYLSQFLYECKWALIAAHPTE